MVNEYFNMLFDENNGLMQVKVENSGMSILIGPFTKYNPPQPPTFVGQWKSAERYSNSRKRRWNTRELAFD